ncbi:uncharacterized protein LOC114530175 [Dendronephthya gigantea]|uniref:uncharacterized protein LOC114530175 n=1 Tax=Dendronephthya gigantea TaxID=151771 RepID=UPI001069E194|nr:uncharacterized protein LOC114530175 [Dendronephthya gigantea]
MSLRPFKVWNCSRTVKKTVVASSLEMLIGKGAEKLELQTKNGVKVMLEEDGSEVDKEYFAFLSQNTVLQLLAIDEKWESAEVTKNQSVKFAVSDVRKETVSTFNVKSRQKTLTSTGALGPPLSLSCETPKTVTLPVDTGTLKDRAKIYSLKDTNEKLYNYHKAINEAAYQIALEDPMIVGNKTELNKLAVAKLDIDGYSYRKKKSRSKQLNPDVDTPKRAKLQSDFRASRIKEVSEDLKEVDKQVQLCTKQRDRYSNSQEFSSAIAISEKIEGLQGRKRKLQTELTMLQRKEARSQKYHSGKKVCRSNETCSATVTLESSANNFVTRGNKNSISVFFTPAKKDSKTKEAEASTVTTVEDSDDSISEGNFVPDETTVQDENTRQEEATPVSTMRERDGEISAGNVENGETTVQEDDATATSAMGANMQISFLVQPML